MSTFATPRRVLAALALAALVGSAPAALAQISGSCNPGVAEGVLNASDVNATVYNTGSLFFNDNTDFSNYVVPAASARSPMYAAGLWVGGRVSSEVRVAASTYGGQAATDWEYWPGPLNDDTSLPNESDCSAYDRIYVVSDADVAAYEDGGTPTADLAAWPVGLGAPAVNMMGASVVATSREQVIDLDAGERPVVPGSQVAFWVMNDVGNIHVSSNTTPLGIEVQVLAFVVDSTDAAFDQATFYRYTIFNRNTVPIEDAYAAFFTDPDLGDATDDYVGSDTSRGMIYTYNADNNDGTAAGYGMNPPVIGLDVLGGPNALMYFVNDQAIPEVADPAEGFEVYNIMQGLWKDSTPMTEGGRGYQTSGDVTQFAFPGDPTVPAFWSERCPNQPTCGTALTPFDRRMVGTSPVFTLAPGDSTTFDVALVFGRGASNLASIAPTQAASDAVQAAYDDGTLFPEGFIVAGEGGPDAPAGYALVAAPNPFSGRSTVAFTLPQAAEVRLAVYDVLGREVAVLADGLRAAGRHEAAFDAAGLPAGAYLYVLRAGDVRLTGRTLLVR